MFTGIVEQKANLVAKQSRSGGVVLSFQPESALGDVALGESIAINGTCLTVVNPVAPSELRFDVSPETLQKTNLGRLELGAWVNLERAMPANGRFSGHVVSGHVDGVGTVTALEVLQEYLRLAIQVPSDLAAFCISKGSVALNGVSLTINSAQDRNLEFMIIPHTQKVTTLGELRMGDQLNVECDLFAKLFVKHMQGKQNEIHS